MPKKHLVVRAKSVCAKRMSSSTQHKIFLCQKFSLLLKNHPTSHTISVCQGAFLLYAWEPTRSYVLVFKSCQQNHQPSSKFMPQPTSSFQHVTNQRKLQDSRHYLFLHNREEVRIYQKLCQSYVACYHLFCRVSPHIILQN